MIWCGCNGRPLLIASSNVHVCIGRIYYSHYACFISCVILSPINFIVHFWEFSKYFSFLFLIVSNFLIIISHSVEFWVFISHFGQTLYLAPRNIYNSKRRIPSIINIELMGWTFITHPFGVYTDKSERQNAISGLKKFSSLPVHCIRLTMSYFWDTHPFGGSVVQFYLSLLCGTLKVSPLKIQSDGKRKKGNTGKF